MQFKRLFFYAITASILSACGSSGGDSSNNGKTDPSSKVTIDAGVEAAAPLNLRGDFNGWGTDPMTFSNGVYAAELDLAPGTHEFKIADEEWTAGTNCGGPAATTIVPDAESVAIECATGSAQNISLNVAFEGSYYFAFSVQDDGTGELQIIAPEQEPDEPTIDQVTLRYMRVDGNYAGWGPHVFGDSVPRSERTIWPTVLEPTRIEDGWAIYEVNITNYTDDFEFVFHLNTVKNPASDLEFNPQSDGLEAWIVQDVREVFFTQAGAEIALANRGNESANLDLSEVQMLNNDSGLPDDWANTATFMEIYVRGYQDSDGDGVGDFNGLRSRLDYLADIGITGLWLMPIAESSDNDHGYAVEDYRRVESDYGTMEEFEQLLDAAHARGIGIIVDYVMNHSSSANPLFIDATIDANNDKADWYIFSDTNPGWTGFGGDSWHAINDQYYYGVFTSSMPDFDLENPEVVDFHLNNLKFWLNKGVDGFRFDAVGVLVENGANAWKDQDENHPILKQVQDTIMAYTNRYMVCESPADPAAYAVSTSCGRAFAFGTEHQIINSAKNGTISGSLINQLRSNLHSTMPLILSNHDSFAGQRAYQQFNGNEDDNKVAASMYILSSPTPFTYYGEEVGLTTGEGLTGDHSLRTPMSWEPDPVTAGFTLGTPFRNLSQNVLTHNVQVEENDPDSLLSHYKSLYLFRRDNPVMGTGQLDIQSDSGDSHLIFTRSDADNTVAVLINLSVATQELTVDVSEANAEYVSALSASSTNVMSNSGGLITVSVPGKGTVVLTSSAQ